MSFSFSELNNVVKSAISKEVHLLEQFVPNDNQNIYIIEWLNAYLRKYPLVNALGKKLKIIENGKSELHYETALLLDGEMNFFMNRYHDWFNLLAWKRWPLTKAALNLRHTLHYAICLKDRLPNNWHEKMEIRIPRDQWMQVIASFDEGGCIISKNCLDNFTEEVKPRLYKFKENYAGTANEKDFFWFGHAIIETFQDDPSYINTLRMFLLDTDSTNDANVAIAILSFHTSLQEKLIPIWQYFCEEFEVIDFFKNNFKISDYDPFAKPHKSIYAPWKIKV